MTQFAGQQNRSRHKAHIYIYIYIRDGNLTSVLSLWFFFFFFPVLSHITLLSPEYFWFVCCLFCFGTALHIIKGIEKEKEIGQGVCRVKNILVILIHWLGVQQQKKINKNLPSTENIEQALNNRLDNYLYKCFSLVCWSKYSERLGKL